MTPFVTLGNYLHEAINMQVHWMWINFAIFIIPGHTPVVQCLIPIQAPPVRTRPRDIWYAPFEASGQQYPWTRIENVTSP